MNSRHIVDLIDSKPFVDLSDAEMRSIESHVGECPSCKKAFDASRIASVLTQARIAESELLEPPPFFRATVMNAIRSQSSQEQPLAVLTRWWQASFSMLAAMLIVVFGLIGAALFAPTSDPEAFTPSNGFYSPDNVIMDQMASRDFTNEQALQELYSSKSEVKK